MRTLSKSSLTVFAFSLWFGGLAAHAEAERPNILIIFGNLRHKTPRMDRLAIDGIRFTSFYAQTLCGPSRSALLTGRYPGRRGRFGSVAPDVGERSHQ